MNKDLTELTLKIKDTVIRDEITNIIMEYETKIIELDEIRKELKDKIQGLNNKCSYKQARINMLEQMIKGVINENN